MRPAFMLIQRAIMALCAVAAIAGTPAGAQSYPDRPIKVIIPFPAGNAIDSLGRILLDRMGETLGQRFVVENQAGVGGNLGTGAAAKSAPDGYTLLISASGPLAINRSLFHSLPYDPDADLAPIGLFAVVPNVLVIGRKLAVGSVAELISLAKSKPDEINYASVGLGSSQHLAAVHFEAVTGVKMRHVPYRAAGQIATDLIGGDLHTSFQLMPNVIGAVQSGDIKALAVAATKRLTAFPSIPTMAEAGVANYESSAWFGMLAPKGTPPAIVIRLNRELVAAMADQKVIEKFVALGAEPVSGSPEAFAAFISAEAAKWSKVIVDAQVPKQ